MGTWDKVKDWIFSTDEGENVENAGQEEAAEAPAAEPRVRPFRVAKEPTQTAHQSGGRMKVVLAKPESISKDGRAIADQIRSGCTIILNMESATPDNCRRLLDFFSGAAYTNDAILKRASNSTYMITPNSNSVDIMGDLILEEIETNELYIDV